MSKHRIGGFKIFGKDFVILKAHIMALVFGIVGWIFGWYGLVLITASIKNGDNVVGNGWFLKPTKIQNLGIVFAILMGVVTWFQRLAAIQGDTSQQP